MQVRVVLANRGGSQAVVWYIDNGCSKHITSNKSLLRSFIPQIGPRVLIGDNFQGQTKEVGSLHSDDVQVDEVSHVEVLKHNLLSVS